jgi:superoxide dismutase, Cu-Zn family
MRKSIAGIIGIAAMSAAAAGAQSAKPTGTAGANEVPATAGAAITDVSGRAVGQARFQETPHGVLLTLELRNATPGVHGLHVHEVGRCDTPRFESAGAHFNPDRRAHGFLNPAGPHAGDLPNVYVPGSTELSVDYLIPDVTLEPGARSLLDAKGSALVIHEGKDDYRTDPGGEAGEHLACGVITSPQQNR